MIEFRTLGTLQLTGADGREVHSVVAQPKPLALLTFLVLESPDGYHRRDTLLGLLWPEHPEQRARHALSQALHVLRQRLGAGVVVTRGQEDIRVDRAQFWCDALAFEKAVEERDYEAALGLYGGDLLEGFFVSEAPSFEQWLSNERIRLQELAAGAAWGLAHQRIDEDKLVDAERTAQRALALVPTDESEVRRFVEALASAGDRAAAVRFYEKFAQRLSDEYDLEPAPETRQLVAALRNRSDQVVDIGQGVPPFNHLSPSGPETAAAQEDAASSRRPSKLAVRSPGTAAIVIMLAVASASGWLAKNRSRGPVFVPNRVVVALFENQTGDSSLAPLAMMASDWIADGLARTGMVEVITPAAVREAFAVAETRGTPWSGSRGTLALAESMHAGIGVSGRLYRTADELTIRAEVVRLPGSTLLGPIDPISVASQDPGPGLEALRQRVMGLLAIYLDPRLATDASAMRQPPVYEAYREFVAALEPGPVSDRIAHMLTSAALDSAFMAPLILAFRASGNLPGIAARERFRDSILEVIEGKQHLLTPVERHELDAARAWYEGDMTGYYTEWNAAARLAPYRLVDLSRAALRTGRYRVVVEVLERPDLPLGAQAYPWKTLTASLHFLEEHEPELRAARRCKEMNPSRLACLEMEGTALVALGRIEELRDVLEEAYLTGSDGSWHWTGVFGGIGHELMWHDHELEGRKVLERVVLHIEAEPQDVRDGRRRLATSLLYLGRHAEARAIWEQLERESPDSDRLDLSARIALAAAGMGDSETALRILTQLKLRVADLPKWYHAWLAFQRAQVAGALGDCDEAVQLLKAALSRGRSHSQIHRRLGLINCRDDPGFQEVAKAPGSVS